MKRALIILSIVMVIASGFVAWWLLSQADFQLESPIIENGEITGYAFLSPLHGDLANLARYASFPLLLLGIALLVISFFRKPAAQITLGIVAAALAVFISLYGFPNEFVSGVPLDGETLKRITTYPGSIETSAQRVTVLVCVLALAIAGISLWQMIKSKKKPISEI